MARYRLSIKRSAALGPGYDKRLSFCCAVQGCPARTTPPSLRFLGRRVYLGAIVVLVTALHEGLTGRRARRLRGLTRPRFPYISSV